MEWDKGYSVSYSMRVVDPATWRSAEPLEIVEGSVNRQISALMESADITCRSFPDEIERWIRVYMDARQDNGASAHVAVFTGLATSPEVSYNGRKIEHPLECYSVLKPAEDVLLPRGWYALAGRNGAEVVSDLLSAGPAPVEIDGPAPVLSSTIIAEDGESNLSMAHKVLLAMNWRLRISGEGVITICPQASEPSARFGENSADCIETAVVRRLDYFSCPNVFRAALGDLYAVAVDDDPDSALSTVSRGREIWAEELSPALADNESLGTYSRRRLKALQEVALTAKYTRRYHPDVVCGDLVELNYPRQGLAGLYRVTNQSVDLGYNGRTAEEVAKL